MAVAFYSSIQFISQTTQAFSVSSGNGYLTIYAESTSSSLTATYAGIAMTLAESLGNVYGSTYGYLFTIPIDTNSIATGSYNAVFSSSASGVSWAGTGINPLIGLHKFNFNANINKTTGSSSVTTTIDNCWAVMLVYASADGISGSGNWNKETSGTPDYCAGDTNGVVHPAGSITQSISCSFSTVVCVQFAVAPYIPTTYTLTAAVQTYTLTGKNLTVLGRILHLVAAVGRFTLTGISAALQYVKNPWQNEQQSSNSFTNQSKSSTSWSNETPSSNSWTNQSKS